MLGDIQAMIETFFQKFGVEYSQLNITENEKQSLLLKIQSEDSGILIGPHGKNLDAIQSVLRGMICQKTGEKIRLHIEVNDYQKTKDERLFQFIQSKIDQVQKYGKNIELPFYSPYERKKIHDYVHGQSLGSIYTQSMGEGKTRRLHICKKSEKLTIDIDGDDI